MHKSCIAYYILVVSFVIHSLKTLTLSHLLIKWLLRIRSKSFHYRKEGFFASHAFAVARVPRKLARSHAHDAFRLLAILLVSKRLPRLALVFLYFNKGKNTRLPGFAIARSRHTRYAFLLAFDSLRSLCELICRRVASLLEASLHKFQYRIIKLICHYTPFFITPNIFI